MDKYLMINELIANAIAICLVLFRITGIEFRKRYILYPVFSLAIIAGILLSDFSPLAIFIGYAILFFILPLILAKGAKKTSVLFTSFAVVGIQSSLIVILRVIAGLINAEEILSFILNILTDYFALAVIAIVIFSKKGYSYIMNLRLVTNKIKIALIVYIWTFWILIDTIELFIDEHTLNYQILVLLLVVIAYSISFAIIYLLIRNNLDSSYYKRLNETMEENVKEQVNHYNQITRANEDLRRFRHDYKNLKLGLSICLEQNDVKGALEYLNGCDDIIEHDYILYKTGHPIVNAIISDKAFQAKEDNIKITFDGLIPIDALNSVDLCIVFGNLLDNAIEACRKFEDGKEKTISVTAVQRSNYLFVIITNPTTENVKIRDNSIQSTKGNNSLHGIGLYSVKDVVNKYSGHLYLSCKNKIFKAEADFSLCPDDIKE